MAGLDSSEGLGVASAERLLALCVSGEVCDLAASSSLDRRVWALVLGQELPQDQLWTLFCSVPHESLFALADAHLSAALLSLAEGCAYVRCIYEHRPDLRKDIRAQLGAAIRKVLPELRAGRCDDPAVARLRGALRLLGCVFAGMDEGGDNREGDKVAEHALTELLLPLHAPNGMVLWRDQSPVLGLYHEPLVLALTRLLAIPRHCNGPSLLQLAVRGLAAQWPRGFGTNTPREVLLLHELDLLLGLMSATDTAALLPLILQLLARALAHDNLVPMQRALEVFKNQRFLTLCAQASPADRLALMRALLPPLYRRGELLWSPTANRMTAAALDALKDIDSAAFQRASEGLSSPQEQDGSALLAAYTKKCRGETEVRAAVGSGGSAPMRFHDLVFGRDLGSGSFSTVRYAKRIVRESSARLWPEVAVKVMAPCPEDVPAVRMRQLYRALREVAVLRMVHHPCVAALLSAFRYHGAAYLVLELGDRDLHALVMAEGPLTEPQARFVLGEVLAALLAMHALGLLFLDLKPENVLLTSTGHVKLTDFGGCRPFTAQARQELLGGRARFGDLAGGDWREGSEEKEEEPDEETHRRLLEEALHSLEGTPAYTPMELLREGAGAADLTKADPWALGCLLSFCLNGRPLFVGAADEVLAAMDALLAPPRASGVSFALPMEGEGEGADSLYRGPRAGRSTDALALLDALLAVLPERRLGIAAAAESRFVTDGGRIDPLSLHLGPAPRLGSGARPTQAAPEQDKWARRQLSVVWAPMPRQYDLHPASSPMAGSPFAVYVDLDAAIPETDVERGGYF